MSGLEEWQRSILPRFMALTAERLEALRAARAAGRAGSGPEGNLAEIGRVAHMIAGTAASFGFDRLDVLARRIEALCADSAQPGCHVASVGPGGLSKELDALEAEIERILRAGGVAARCGTSQTG